VRTRDCPAVDTVDLFRGAIEAFDQRVRQIDADQWQLDTPCDDWNVRALVNHVLNEDLWCIPLLKGQTIADVGDRFDGDLLGDDPQATWTAAVQPAIDAVSAPGAMEATTHLSFGDVPGREYTMQLFADHLIHAWDLARAIGADETLPADLVEGCATWFAEREELYRGAGVIGDRVELGAETDPQQQLLAAFGRDPR
jgi:uncharacterized protein (TIGR03086 family)